MASPHSMIGKICDSLTDAVTDCLKIDRVRKQFDAMSFFLVAADTYCW